MASFRSKVKAAVKKVANKASSAAKNVATNIKAAAQTTTSAVNKARTTSSSNRGSSNTASAFQARIGEGLTPAQAQRAETTTKETIRNYAQPNALKPKSPLIPAVNALKNALTQRTQKSPSQLMTQDPSLRPGGSSVSPTLRPGGSSVSPMLQSRAKQGRTMSASVINAMQGTPRSFGDTKPTDQVAGSQGSPQIAPNQTDYEGQTGIEQTSYRMPGQKQDIQKQQLSQAQASVIAMQNQLSEKKQAAAEAAATATTPEEQDDIDRELERIDRQERALEREYERLLRQSDEESQTQSQIDALSSQEAAIEAGAREGITNVEGQPIAQGFITGQSAGIQKMANARLESVAAQKIPLNLRLARAQAQRQAALDVAKNRLSSIGDRRKLFEDRRKERKNDLRYQQEQDRLGQFELGEGQTRYDRYGRVIASRPKTQTTSTKTSKYKISQDDIDEGSNILQEQLRNSPDGYVNSGTYLDMYRTWVENGGTLSQFKTYYPPNEYLNPEDPSIPAYLRPSGGGNNNGPY